MSQDSRKTFKDEQSYLGVNWLIEYQKLDNKERKQPTKKEIERAEKMIDDLCIFVDSNNIRVKKDGGNE